MISASVPKIPYRSSPNFLDLLHAPFVFVSVANQKLSYMFVKGSKRAETKLSGFSDVMICRLSFFNCRDFFSLVTGLLDNERNLKTLYKSLGDYVWCFYVYSVFDRQKQ